MLTRHLIALLLFVVGAVTASPVFAQQAETNAAPPPDSALTARFNSFFSDVLAGRVPSNDVSQQVRSGLTPQLLSQIRGSFASLGTFRQLQYVRQDAVQEYRRFHYRAVFDNGNQGVMFVVDTNNTIVGFFEDPNQ
jgi:hypothetical protein